MAGAILAAVAFNKQTYLSKTDNVGNALSSEMSGDSSLRKSMLSFAGLGLILLSVIFIDKTDNFPGWRAMIPVLGAVIIIYSGQQAWVNKHILSSKTCRLYWINKLPTLFMALAIIIFCSDN